MGDGSHDKPNAFSVLDRPALVTLIESYFGRVRKLGGDTGECCAYGLADWLMWDGKVFLPSVAVASSHDKQREGLAEIEDALWRLHSYESNRDDAGRVYSEADITRMVEALRLSKSANATIAAIAAERQRQVEVEGWDAEHDDAHPKGALAKAAACYAVGEPVFRNAGPFDHDSSDRGWRGPYPRGDSYTPLWPWSSDWWKPKDRRRDLIRAAALIVAELERIDRADSFTKDA